MDHRDHDVGSREAAAALAALGRRADGASGPPAAGSAAKAANRAQRRALKYGHTLKTNSRTGRQKIEAGAPGPALEAELNLIAYLRNRQGAEKKDCDNE